MRPSAKLSVNAGRLSVSLMCTLAAAVSTFADGPYQVTVERGVEAKMRDRVVLRADIYRPDAAGKFPVLLERTPYNKGAG